MALGAGERVEQDNCAHSQHRKTRKAGITSERASEQGQIRPQPRLCSISTHPPKGSVHFPQPREEFGPQLFRIHETEKLFYPNCQLAELISTSLATGKTNYDREKKWTLAACFPRLLLKRL